LKTALVEGVDQLLSPLSESPWINGFSFVIDLCGLLIRRRSPRNLTQRRSKQPGWLFVALSRWSWLRGERRIFAITSKPSRRGPIWLELN